MSWSVEREWLCQCYSSLKSPHSGLQTRCSVKASTTIQSFCWSLQHYTGLLALLRMITAHSATNNVHTRVGTANTHSGLDSLV
ncbi:hypothetical protein E2C01_037912 [Portunus trituberculatus]|uniref:Uncharacterized protein n=1 Tax=Portunus trituberculatus TaxID=210409 RepID=A0A5B7FIG7_PORTR|nr:hypothetical protein [Portunus trituberculatus]